MWRKEFVYKSFLVIVHLSLFVSYVKKWKLSNKKHKLLCVYVRQILLVYFCLYTVHLFANLGKHHINYCVHVYVWEILFICFACTFVCKLGRKPCKLFCTRIVYVWEILFIICFSCTFVCKLGEKKASQVILVFLLDARSNVFIQGNGCTCGWKVSDVYIYVCLIQRFLYV